MNVARKAGIDELRRSAIHSDMVRTPEYQLRILTTYEARLAQIPWWRFKERRELTQRYQMLTS